MVFRGSRYNALTVRVDDTPPCFEPFLPSKKLQSVRIDQFVLMFAILIVLRVCDPRLQGTYCRIHVDNISAMYACLNTYSSNSFMARLAGEIWLELLQWGISRWWQYVPSKLNVADIFSRPDKKVEGRQLSEKWKWVPIDPRSSFLPLSRVLRTRPEVAWGELHARFYSGK